MRKHTKAIHVDNLMNLVFDVNSMSKEIQQLVSLEHMP